MDGNVVGTYTIADHPAKLWDQRQVTQIAIGMTRTFFSMLNL
jgi:hypothetical protein